MRYWHHVRSSPCALAPQAPGRARLLAAHACGPTCCAAPAHAQALDEPTLVRIDAWLRQLYPSELDTKPQHASPQRKSSVRMDTYSDEDYEEEDSDESD